MTSRKSRVDSAVACKRVTLDRRCFLLGDQRKACARGREESRREDAARSETEERRVFHGHSAMLAIGDSARDPLKIEPPVYTP